VLDVQQVRDHSSLHREEGGCVLLSLDIPLLVHSQQDPELCINYIFHILCKCFFGSIIWIQITKAVNSLTGGEWVHFEYKFWSVVKVRDCRQSQTHQQDLRRVKMRMRKWKRERARESHSILLHTDLFFWITQNEFCKPQIFWIVHSWNRE
jgi:hypothetical protein